MPTKLTALTQATLPLTGAETLYAVQGGNSRRTTLANIGGGENAAVATTAPAVSLGTVPTAAKEVDVLFNAATYAAGQTINLQFIDAAGHSFFTTRHYGINGVSPAVSGQSGDAFFLLDSDASARAISGVIHLRRFGDVWGISGSLRRDTTFMITYSGLCNFGANTFTGVSVFSDAAMTAGTAAVRWRF